MRGLQDCEEPPPAPTLHSLEGKPRHQVLSAEISSSVCFVSIRSLVSSAGPGTEELDKYLLNTSGRHSDLYSPAPITWMGKQPQRGNPNQPQAADTPGDRRQSEVPALCSQGSPQQIETTGCPEP